MSEHYLAFTAALAGVATAHLGDQGTGSGFAPYLGFGAPRSPARGAEPWPEDVSPDSAPAELWRHILLAPPPTIS